MGNSFKRDGDNSKPRFLATKPTARICMKEPKCGKMDDMEIQPITIEAILQWFQKQAARKQTEIVIQTRIALNSHEARILDARQERPLETIRF